MDYYIQLIMGFYIPMSRHDPCLQVQSTPSPYLFNGISYTQCFNVFFYKSFNGIVLTHILCEIKLNVFRSRSNTYTYNKQKVP
jgi:hypothetical protein